MLRTEERSYRFSVHSCPLPQGSRVAKLDEYLRAIITLCAEQIYFAIPSPLFIQVHYGWQCSYRHIPHWPHTQHNVESKSNQASDLSELSTSLNVPVIDQFEMDYWFLWTRNSPHTMQSLVAPRMAHGQDRIGCRSSSLVQHIEFSCYEASEHLDEFPRERLSMDCVHRVRRSGKPLL